MLLFGLFLLSIASLTAGQENYYVRYYLAEGEPPGVWQGKGAERLGLQGEVTKEAFKNLCRGFSPDGLTKYVRNAGTASRKPGQDCTFSAPKSVSLAGTVSSDRDCVEVQQSHEAGVQAGISYLEQGSVVRYGKDGVFVERAETPFAVFNHLASRASDPQIHSHAVAISIGVTKNGKTYAVDFREFYERKMAAGALYRAELAYQLKQRLGVELRKVRSWFEIASVPESLVKNFSKRRLQILRQLGIDGFEKEHETVIDAKLAAIEAVKFREKKRFIPRAQHKAIWRKRCEELGVNPDRLIKRTEQRVAINPEETLTRIIGELTRWNRGEKKTKSILQGASFFSEATLVRRVAEEAQIHGIQAKTILDTVYRYLQSDAVVQIKQKNRIVYTTREVLAEERALLQSAAALTKNQRHTVSPIVIQGVIDQQRRKQPLSSDQEQALRHITEKSGAISLVTGYAGAGKTTMLHAAHKAWRKEGFRVIGAALAARAARGLKAGAGLTESMSVAKLLNEIEKGKPSYQIRQAVIKTFASAIRPQKRDQGIRLTDRTVLVIDEAAVIGTRQMKRLIEEVSRAGAKLVLIGDTKQLQPIEAGGPFAALARRFGSAELTENFRQKESWAKEAVLQFRKGQVKEALESYARRGLVTVRRTRREAIQALVKDWSEEVRSSTPNHHLMIAATGKEVAELNRQAQELFRRRNAQTLFIAGPRERFYVGDRVMFTENSRSLEVANGELGTVTEISIFKRTLTITLDEGGKKIEFDPKRSPNLTLGFAITAHKSQGTTVEQNAYVLAGGEMTDRHLAYVQASRAKGSTKFYLDRNSYDVVTEQMKRDRTKDLAASYKSIDQSLEQSY
jgi:conjugative relaxase-like TrwC/TraI family protein